MQRAAVYCAAAPAATAAGSVEVNEEALEVINVIAVMFASVPIEAPLPRVAARVVSARYVNATDTS